MYKYLKEFFKIITTSREYDSVSMNMSTTGAERNVCQMTSVEQLWKRTQESILKIVPP